MLGCHWRPLVYLAHTWRQCSLLCCFAFVLETEFPSVVQVDHNPPVFLPQSCQSQGAQRSLVFLLKFHLLQPYFTCLMENEAKDMVRQYEEDVLYLQDFTVLQPPNIMCSKPLGHRQTGQANFSAPWISKYLALVMG